MEDLYISVLGPLSHQAIQDLQKKQIEATCFFNMQPDCQDEDQFVFSENPFLFQIRQNHIVQCQPKSKRICGGIPLTLDHKFQVKRYQNDPQSSFGKPYAFILYLPQVGEQYEEVVIKIGVDDKGAKDLQKFVRCLQTKTIFQYQSDLSKNFKLLQRLYYSRTVVIYSVISLRDQKEVAMKLFSKANQAALGRDLKKSIQRQYGIPLKLKHRNICEYYGLYENQTSICIILQRFQLNFLQYIQSKPNITNEQLKSHFYKICLSISILHQDLIMHRDIKPENIMMRKISQSEYQPILIDFGLAEYENKKPYLFTRCGTAGYVAPQITECKDPKTANYNRSCDIFSLGCLFHFITLKRPLFNGSTEQEVRQKNKQCNINPESELYKFLKKSEKDLLFKMLERDPQKRITIEKTLMHEYFQQNKQSTSKLTEELSQENSADHQNEIINTNDANINKF